jgi:predicted phage terminase large subunit-like protein
MMLSPEIAYRQRLRFFLREVFRQLHPGEPPLKGIWYLEAMCFALEEARAGRCPRLVINVPPRHLKSVTASVAYCAWLLGHDPSVKILVGTYNEDLARLHDHQTRRIMESPEYRATFPGTLIAKRQTRQLELHTTMGGFRMAVTTGGSATGFGGDFIILDDCMKAQEAKSEAERLRVKDWYRGTMGTRLNDKRDGVVISIQQRLHEDDLAALLLDGGAAHLNLPAIATKRERIAIGQDRFHERMPGDLLSPEREDRAVLDRIRREIGPREFSTQYLQDPTPPGGNIVRLDWFSRYDDPPERDQIVRLVQSWDTAWSIEPNAAYSVCTTWGRFAGRWYLLDVFRARLELPDLKRAVVRLWQRWKADTVLIEQASSGEALRAYLFAEGPFRPAMCRVAESKEDRLIAQTGQLEAGLIVLPSEAPWLEAFCRELLAAPNGRYWDQVDSMTQFLEYTLSPRGRIEYPMNPETGRRHRVVRRNPIQRSIF